MTYKTKPLTPIRRALVAISLVMIASQSFAGERSAEKKRRGPPPQAIEACQGLESSAQCSFEGRRGEMAGICFTPSDDKPLACKPERAGKRKQNGENDAEEGV